MQTYVLPTLVMERHHGHVPHAAHYRIEIYRDGRGYYYGLRNVRVLGEVPFTLSPQQVNDLLDKFKELGFWQLGDDLDFSGPADIRLRYQFEVRKDGQNKRLFSVGNPKYGAFHVILEQAVNSARWRCPFTNADMQIDLCASEEQRIKYYTNTLPQLGGERGKR